MKLSEENIYRLLRTVPAGKVTTYKALASALGTKAYRYVGQVMKRNPDAPHTPCHRVVASNGTLGGFMGHTSGPELQKKKRLLQGEGVHIEGNRINNFKDICITSFRE